MTKWGVAVRHCEKKTSDSSDNNGDFIAESQNLKRDFSLRSK
ncbi:hypothetical protein ACWIUD_03070 [Helicobacter sp. 23-1044]